MDYEAYIRACNQTSGLNAAMGMRITSVKEGEAWGEIVIQQQHLNPTGGVNGGTLFALMDTLATTAAMTRGNYATTSSADIHFLSPTKSTKTIIGVAKEVKNGRSLLVHDVTLYDDAQRLVARATFTNFRLEQKVEI